MVPPAEGNKRKGKRAQTLEGWLKKKAGLEEKIQGWREALEKKIEQEKAKYEKLPPALEEKRKQEIKRLEELGR